MTKEHPQEYLVLGLLMRESRHGYEINQYFSSRLGRAWHAGMSQIYALLKRLEETGKVVSALEMQDNRPAKKVYSITPKGCETFLSWVSQPVERIRDLRLEFLSKLFFMRELNLPGLSELIDKQIDVCNDKVFEIKANDGSDVDTFNQLISEFRTCQVEAILKWLQDCKTHFGL